MNFIQKSLFLLTGDEVFVSCPDTCLVLLLDAPSFATYRSGADPLFASRRGYLLHHGEAVILAPGSGFWHVVLDLGNRPRLSFQHIIAVHRARRPPLPMALPS